MKVISFALSIALILALSGCSTVRSEEGLLLNVQTDPTIIHSGSFTDVHIDVDNRNNRALEKVLVKIFDAGLLQNPGCEKSFQRLLPFEFQTFTCRLYAPVVTDSIQTEINMKAYYFSTFSASQVFQVISEDEEQRRIGLNDYTKAPKSYSYMDKNVQIDVEFSDQPPFVALPDKKYFVYFTIRNVGSGFIENIVPGDLLLSNADPRFPVDFIRCPALTNTLYPDGREFPRIACEIVIPRDSLTNVNILTSNFIITLNYVYELRDRLPVQITK